MCSNPHKPNNVTLYSVKPHSMHTVTMCTPNSTKVGLSIQPITFPSAALLVPEAPQNAAVFYMHYQSHRQNKTICSYIMPTTAIGWTSALDCWQSLSRPTLHTPNSRSGLDVSDGTQSVASAGTRSPDHPALNVVTTPYRPKIAMHKNILYPLTCMGAKLGVPY
jgi:hypothetical protein